MSLFSNILSKRPSDILYLILNYAREANPYEHTWGLQTTGIIFPTLNVMKKEGNPDTKCSLKSGWDVTKTKRNIYTSGPFKQ